MTTASPESSLLTDAPLSAEAAALATGPAAHPLHPAHTPTGQLSFGVFFQGVNSSTIWRLPESGDQVPGTQRGRELGDRAEGIGVEVESHQAH